MSADREIERILRRAGRSLPRRRTDAKRLAEAAEAIRGDGIMPTPAPLQSRS
ncbi:hypothetical protein FB566_1293 [Stackebrandtia endophytica]|uniref:Uncharacterized protein n=1 Tax=Stackebrandtia endophytica TaxID=1496996 RepID=A0A543AT84_9ACTN|nr:hypothetical protein FB566_1293 [Stackebrandtia endophytica]